MIIYSPSTSNRLTYTLKTIFNDILKVDFKIVENAEDAYQSNEKIISYSKAPIENSFHVYPAGLLFEQSVKEQFVKIDKYNELITIFHTGQGDVPFDIFSAVFYMVSRYEEYLPFKGDLHGRFRAEDSIAYKNKFHRLPVVELWCKLVADKLNIPFPSGSFKLKLTIDIDNAWKHRNKGFFRSAGGFLKLILSGNFPELNEKIKVLSGNISDPADTFKYIESIENKLSEPVQYFILAGTKGRNDRAISLKNKEFKQILKNLNSKKTIGIHPSYLSFFSKKELEKEYLNLCAVFKNKITKSRQHFLLIKFPETYRNIMKLGIREDYSMGWSSQVGFRAGISSPFLFYDLLAEKETHLMVNPFVAMDRTLKDYMKLKPGNALMELKKMSDITKSVEGEFVMLWHNDSLNDSGEWKGWKTVFEQTLNYAEQNQIPEA